MKKESKVFSFLKKLLFSVYPKMEFIGEPIPEGPCIFVGNHCQMNGPIISELYFPEDTYAWCIGQMVHLKEVPAYAFADFWSQKPKWTHPYYKVMSYLIAPLSVYILRHARAVPVYKDHRAMSTFKKSLNLLKDGKKVLIFPEYDKKKNQIIYDFKEKFIDLAFLYHRKTGQEISFIPFYNAPKLKKTVIGKPIVFKGTEDKEKERETIRLKLMDEITKLGESLPCHTVIPYRNIPKKYYPKNKSEE